MNDLTSKLIKEFAQVTNDAVEKHEGAVVYGEISIVNEDTFIKIDGSDILTPCTTTVKVKTGHRVIATVKDHKVTVTSNITDPSAYGIIVDEMGITLKGFVTIESLAGGKTTIDGSCIKTGTIDAERLNLTGAIKFSDLSTDAQNKINNATPKSQFSVTGVSGWHDVMTDDDKFRRDSSDGGVTWGPAYQFRGTDGKPGQNGQDGSDANVPNYIKSTYIDGESVSSPVLRGGIISGASFTDLNQKSVLVLNPSDLSVNVADLVLYHGSTKAFVIYDLMDGIDLYAYGVHSMRISGVSRATVPQGTWDFSKAEVIGLEGGTGDGYAKFK